MSDFRTGRMVGRRFPEAQVHTIHWTSAADILSYDTLSVLSEVQKLVKSVKNGQNFAYVIYGWYLTNSKTLKAENCGSL